jgi:hypothetical protein
MQLLWLTAAVHIRRDKSTGCSLTAHLCTHLPAFQWGMSEGGVFVHTRMHGRKRVT